MVAPLRAGHINMAYMIALLVDGATIPEIVEETGLHETTVSNYIKALRHKGVCAVVDWQQDRNGRWSIAVHRLGRGRKDKPKPARLNDDPAHVNKMQRDRAARRHDLRLLGIPCAPTATPTATA